MYLFNCWQDCEKHYTKPIFTAKSWHLGHTRNR